VLPSPCFTSPSPVCPGRLPKRQRREQGASKKVMKVRQMLLCLPGEEGVPATDAGRRHQTVFTGVRRSWCHEGPGRGRQGSTDSKRLCMGRPPSDPNTPVAVGKRLFSVRPRPQTSAHTSTSPGIPTASRAAVARCRAIPAAAASATAPVPRHRHQTGFQGGAPDLLPSADEHRLRNSRVLLSGVPRIGLASGPTRAYVDDGRKHSDAL
jgi:hypothetical protein